MKYALLLSFLVFFVFACKKKETENSPSTTVVQSGVILPLDTGNYWLYRDRKMDENDSVYDDRSFGFNIGADTIIKGQKWFNIEANTWYSNKSDGLWQLTGHSQALVYKYPVTKGSTYTTTTTILQTPEKVSVLSIDTLIIVPKGSYHTICYKFESGGDVAYAWFAPNIGMVLQENISPKSSGNGTYISEKLELTSFVIK